MALAKSTGTANLKLLGNEFDNILQGNAGNNVLDGKGGNDTLSGQRGNDIYVVDQAGDLVIETAGNGNDTVVSTASYALAAGQEVETLQFATQAARTAIDLSGNEFANTLRGNAGRNILDGRGGADALYGLGGDDLYIVDNSRDLVFEAKGGGIDTIVSTVSYAMAAGQEIEKLELSGVTGTRALNLIGNEFANTLRGNSGNNTLDGVRGVDTAIGGRGNDTYWVDNAKDIVVEAGGAGHDTLIATVSYTLAAGQSIEVLRLAGTASLDLAGNALAQTIVGNVAANILDGKGGADILQGGKGNDIYVVDSAADRVVEGRGAGVDIVVAGVSYTLAAGQEIEAMQFSASVGTASLNLTGNEFGQTLFGNGGANVLNGGLGNDTLAGKLGADTLIGGRGADIFRFDTQVGRGNVDRISDFSHADDTIHLSKDVFSTLMKGKLAASVFKDIGAAGAMIDASDRVLYDSRDGALYYDANGSGSGGRTLIAVIDNDAKLDHTDFFVV